MLGTIAKLPLLGLGNAIGGAFIGFAKGAILLWLVLFIALFFPLSPDIRDGLHQSRLAPYLVDLRRAARRRAPFDDSLVRAALRHAVLSGDTTCNAQSRDSIAASAPRTSASVTSPIVPKRTIFPRARPDRRRARRRAFRAALSAGAPSHRRPAGGIGCDDRRRVRARARDEREAHARERRANDLGEAGVTRKHRLHSLGVSSAARRRRVHKGSRSAESTASHPRARSRAPRRRSK